MSKRDRGHVQLINTSVYDQKMQQKQLDMEETAKLKAQTRNEREKSKVIRLHETARPSPGNEAPEAPRDVVINNLHFRIAADGSKLIRVFGESDLAFDVAGQALSNADGSNKDAQATPKQAKIAGVTFHRSKNGNLYRAGIVKKKIRYQETSRKKRKMFRIVDWFTQRDENNQERKAVSEVYIDGYPKLQTESRPVHE